MLKKILSYSTLIAVIGFGVYAYMHFNEDQKSQNRFALDYIYPNADFLIEFNSIDQAKLNLSTLRNVLPKDCKSNAQYKQILTALQPENFIKAYLGVYACEKTCLLVESKQNLKSLEISDWNIEKASKNLWLIKDATIDSNENEDYAELKTFLKPSSNSRVIVKNKNGNYSVHEIQTKDNNYHFKGFVLQEENNVAYGANMDLNSVTQLLPKESSKFTWRAIASELMDFKENDLKEFIHFSIPNGGNELSFTALKMKINTDKAQSTFKVANSAIGVVGNTSWMEELIPQMDLATHYSLFRDWIVCGSSKNDMEIFADNIKKGDWNKNPDYSSFKSKLGMNLSSLEYNKLDGGAMEIVQNVFTTEGQHYNIIDIIDSDQRLAIDENLDRPDPIEPDNFELKEIAELREESPFEFINHYTREVEWVIQDEDLNLVLMNQKKEVLFKKKLDSPVMGEFKMVDALKNNKYQILFNTEKSIYLVDRKGRDVENFPIKLESTASNELAVVDYDNNKNYRLFLGLDNGQVLNLGINGKRVKGWKYKAKEKAIIYPVTHLRMGSKDYLFTLNEDYEIQLLDRRGKIRHPLKDQPEGLDNLAIEIFKEDNIQSSGIKYNASGKEKKFVFGKATS